MDVRGPRTGKSTSRRDGISRRKSFLRRSPISSNSVRARHHLKGEGERKMRTVRAMTIASSLAILAVLFEAPVSTHHSFAMYDQKKVVTLTGVVRQFVPQANHAEIHFMLFAPDHKSLMKGPDGKYVEWGIEMAGTAQLERQGIGPATFGA